MADNNVTRPPQNAANTQPASPQSGAPSPPPEQIEAVAQAEAKEARKKLLDDLKARQTFAPSAKKGAAPEGLAPGAAPPEAFTTSPGQERWPVKTGTDDDVGNVDLTTSQNTTVEDLWLQQRPGDMPLTGQSPQYQSRRAEPTETTVWTIEGTITMVKIEKDGDYHVVMQGDMRHMIVEVPDPGDDYVDPASPFKAQIAEARRQFQDKFDPQPFPQSESQRARITGVGFFDFKHGQTGFATTNGIELHPVLSVQWLDGAGNGGSGNGGGGNGQP